ncbi:uncharacterized protein G2W53_009782 [Senna tora]|uniref:Uncharacterized protein n=1 Tax=Senna tora TaxID=362788 RepID=A0A834WYS5_9FABA|nr:uncharacterized protein G2W53_009782 [Senna tora]
MLRLESSWHGRSVDHVLTYSGDKSRSDLRNLHELRGKRLVAQVSQTRRFALYSRIGVVLMLRLESSWHGRSVDHVLTYSGRKIAVGSQNLHELRGKRLVAQVSQTSVRVLFANRSGFDAPIGVVLAWERGSCLNISGRKISDLRNLHELRGKRLVAQVSQTRRESNTSVRVVFANRSGFDALIGVVLAWERGSCPNIFRTTNRGQISKTSRITSKRVVRESNTSVRVVFANRSGFDAPFESSWNGRSVDHVLTYPDDKSRSDLRNLHTRIQGKRLVAQVSQTRRFALYSRTGVVLMLRLESSWHGRSVDHVLTYSGRKITVGSQKPSRITRQKTCCASESNTSVRVVFANWSGFDAPIGVVLAWEERDHVLTYSGRKIEVGSQKPSRITSQKTCSASESNTSVRVVFANRSGFDAPIGVVLAREERGSCPNISGRQIAVGSQKLHELRGRRLVAQGIGKVNFWYKEGRMNVWFERIMSMRLNSKLKFLLHIEIALDFHYCHLL